MVYNRGMDKADLISILQSQASLQKTKDGWPMLWNGMIEASNASVMEANEGTVEASECGNCHFVASSKYFARGCPNCGVKGSVEPLQVV